VSGKKGGTIILAVGIFGIGYLAAPEARTVTEKETKVVTVQLPPKTRTVTETQVVTEPLPTSCAALVREAELLDAASAAYSKALSPALGAIGDGRLAIATDDIVGTNESIETLSDVSVEIATQTRVLVEAQERLADALAQCKADSKN
jgi:hypothetical protein